MECLDDFLYPQILIKENENTIAFYYSKRLSDKTLYRRNIDGVFSRIRNICNSTYWVCMHVYIRGHDSISGEDFCITNFTMDIPYKNVSAYEIQKMFYQIFFPLYDSSWDYGVYENERYIEATSIDYFKIVMKRSKPKNKQSKRRGMSNRLRTKVLDRDDYTCQMCGKTIDDGVKLHVDHIVPVSKGGDNNIDNLQTLCSDCNHGKFNHTDYKATKKLLGEENGED